MTLALNGVPNDLAEKLVDEYLEIKKRYSMNDWGPGQLKGGRFVEAVLRIFQHLLSRAVTPLGTDIPPSEKTTILNTVQNHSTIDEHVRQKIVPIVRLLLDFRNNRDSAHLGGFDANDMDTLFVMTSGTWVLCELIRVYGGYQMLEAQKMVNGLAVKEYPIIMEFDGDVFITRHNLTAKQEVLVLLNKYLSADFAFLSSKTRDRNTSRFRSTLGNMVTQKMIGNKDGQYFLMPRGMRTITDEALLSYA